ncbi:hypothetical protein AB0M79_28505 [Polymorphospora sp. NPDC051019]|uniref:hypothetical protein n=1 Tax=Polymorphospora sp. NPDC051019 TaxID=3155725 RepID=UPI00343FD841
MNHPHIRALWLALAALTATLLGTAAGIISWIGSRDVGSGLLVGGAAFSGGLLLIITSINFVVDRP